MRKILCTSTLFCLQAKETGKKKGFPFFKKKSKENEKDQTAPKTLTQQGPSGPAVPKVTKVFKKEQPKPKEGVRRKVKQPSPAASINNNDEEYYNDAASPCEYSDTEMHAEEPQQPLYENVEVMRQQGISGTNSPLQEGPEGQGPVYGNVDSAISYVNVAEDPRRATGVRRITNKRDSKC